MTIHLGREVRACDFDHLKVLAAAMEVYVERNGERDEVWRRSGAKGMTMHCYAKAERAFAEVMSGRTPNPDNFIDLINYAAFAYRLGDDLNGSWPWPR
jgi:hypothetical protein